MGKEKAGFLTPKAIGNRIKAKGLQKLRWYCQMCQKQCRDENGFKCHTMSESHQRQMQMFSENSTKFMDEFSREFEEGMMEIIKRKARSQRQNANQMYRDYIADKQHFHMNATIWETLTDFVMYLGRSGKCEVDETEKGWFVTYIDRDPATLAKMEARAKREREDLDSEEKHQREIQKQVKKAKQAGEIEEVQGATELVRQEGQERIALSLGGGSAGGSSGLGGGGGGGGSGGGLMGPPKPKLAAPRPNAAFGMAAEEDEPAAAARSGSGSGGGGSSSGGGVFSAGGGGKRPMSSMEALMLEERGRKEKAERAKAMQLEAEEAAMAASLPEARKEYWLSEGLVVKVINKKLANGKYYKKKGEVEKVVERYTGHVRMIETGDLLQLDMEDLETVIPSAGGRVRIVNGRGRGLDAVLLSINEEKYSVHVRIEGGPCAGMEVSGVEYEDCCKLVS